MLMSVIALAQNQEMASNVFELKWGAQNAVPYLLCSTAISMAVECFHILLATLQLHCCHEVAFTQQRYIDIQR